MLTKANLFTIVTLLLSEVAAKPTDGGSAPSSQIAIAVEGMTCGACTSTVTAVLSAVPGVQSVNVSLDTNAALVAFDPSVTNPGVLCDLIEGVGFGASPINPVDAGGAQIAVDGMTCASCSNTVDAVLRSIPGVASVTVDLATNIATVKWSASNATGSEANATSLCELIEAVGFGASVLSTEAVGGAAEAGVQESMSSAAIAPST